MASNLPPGTTHEMIDRATGEEIPEKLRLQYEDEYFNGDEFKNFASEFIYSKWVADRFYINPTHNLVVELGAGLNEFLCKLQDKLDEYCSKRYFGQ